MAENKGSEPRDTAAKPGGDKNQQRAAGGSSSGHYTGAPGSAHEGFIPSSPESNVFPAGAPQSGHGSASGHAVAGGTAGAIEASRNRQGDTTAHAPEDDGGSGDAGMGNRGSR
jgi:hypothetical protein